MLAGQSLPQNLAPSSKWHAGCTLHYPRQDKKLFEGDPMRRLLTSLSCILFVVTPLFAEVASAADQNKEDDRLRNSGTVVKEILDVPDNIPQDLLDKADCVVVFPSLLKAAFIFGATHARGPMPCPTRAHFR